MDLILVDWTRMGRLYCLAGAVLDAKPVRIVRPLQVKHREAPVRNVGWSPYLLDGHARWDIFELIGPVSADPEPPHLEDVWVRALRPRRRSATPEQRRDVLKATSVPPSEPVFGASLIFAASTAHL